MRFVAYLSLGCVFAHAASAGELIYTPINPQFGGNPMNASALQYEASAQKPNAPASSQTQQSTEQQFLQMLQSQLYASLANSVASAITGQNAQGSGTITLNTLTISWSTGSCGGSVSGICSNITITDSSTGQITTISVPKLNS
jgi:curli production assembly/transport component CsgF